MEHPLGRDLLAAVAPPTRLPLDRALTDRIVAAHARAALGPRPATAIDIPTLADLEALWPLLYPQLRVLRRSNLDDRAFLRELWDRARARGRRCSKHLFDIWLSLKDPPRTILEIGCRTGLSLINKLFLHPAPERTACVVFDAWLDWGSPGVVLRNLEHIGVPGDGVFILSGDSRELVPAFASAASGCRFDYVLVDGSHAPADARVDLHNAVEIVAPGGWLIFDDTGPADDGSPGCALISVWDEIMRPLGREFELRHYDVGYGFAVARRRAL